MHGQSVRTPGKSTSYKFSTKTAFWAASLLAVSAIGQSSFGADATDQNWKHFRQALGQPALIGANADHELANTAYRPVPAFSQSDLDTNKLRLGFDLFHERRLSVDNSVGCNSCHSGMFGGTDGRVVSEGANGALGKLNAPTTFNAAFNFRQFWDGRAITLEEQALGPIENELEMAHDLGTVLTMLQNNENYSAEFSSVYDDGVTIHNMADAIAYFQRVNFTRAGTPFVRHLEGEEGQLSEQALRGWQRFDEVGCASCHNGINLGGNSYQQLGSVFSWFEEHRVAGPNDIGLMGRSNRSIDQHVFKVPTLHGVAETAPYFHNGSVETLEQAVEEMAEHQLGRMLGQQDIDDITAFLRSLGGRPMGMAMGNAGMGRGMGMSREMGSGMGSGMQGGMGGGMRGGMRGGMGMRGAADAASAAEPTSDIGASGLKQENSHHLAYLAALENADTAKEKMLSEMRRIHSGEVAHFDFLQYQHLELIRYASALHHPPSELSEDSRAQLAYAAETLLAETHKLEWIIADFLRAEAMLKILQTHVDQPETGALEAQIGNVASLLEENRAIARQMLDQMAASEIDNLSGKLGQLYTSSL
ncbi:MAG: cytochrome c peroxidase [Pseudohongiella sp.]|nr:cytochrome c peroxidase [Pseudohongiella sp.]